jgi:hypothetical protein
LPSSEANEPARPSKVNLYAITGTGYQLQDC